jgi:hypothetical protein
MRKASRESEIPIRGDWFDQAAEEQTTSLDDAGRQVLCRHGVDTAVLNGSCRKNNAAKSLT